MKFQTTLFQAEGMNATGIKVPDEVVEALGAGKRPAVKVTFNDFTYRTTIASMGGVFMMPVSAEIREKAGVKAGDPLDVEIELDTEPRTIEAPEDLAAALAQDATANTHWESLSYSKKRAIVLNVEGTKNPETRARRVEKAIAQLGEGKP
jgi:uncharacterized protein YdeI (YjbR/CyaY-like superfamily)